LTIYIIPTSAGSSAQNMDEGNAEGLPPGAAESVSIDTAGWDLYAENGTELHCLSVCGQLFNSHSLEYAINTDWQEQLASPRDTRDQESSTRVLLLPPPMGRESLSSSTASGAPSSTTFVWCSELHDSELHDAATTQAANNMPLAGPGFQFARGTDGRMTIGAIAPGGPANAEGSLAVGDEMMSVDDLDCSKASAQEVRAAILGVQGSIVRFKVYRRMERRTFDVLLARGSTEGGALRRVQARGQAESGGIVEDVGGGGGGRFFLV
jgi:hypothetical protein